MLRPEPAHAVRGAVIPVIAELLDEEGAGHGPGIDGQGEEAVFPDPGESGTHQQEMHDGFGGVIAQAQAAAGDDFAPVETLAGLGDIPAAGLAVQPEEFDDKTEDEQRRHGQDDHLLPVHMRTEDAVDRVDDVLHMLPALLTKLLFS